MAHSDTTQTTGPHYRDRGGLKRTKRGGQGGGIKPSSQLSTTSPHRAPAGYGQTRVMRGRRGGRGGM